MHFKKIYIEITDKCNLRCPFCATSGANGGFMDPEHFEIILNKIKGCTRHISLHVLGEPLLHPELITLLKHCANALMAVNLTTNGILLDSLGMNLLNEKALRQLNISLHSHGGHSHSDKIASYIKSMISYGKYAAEQSPVIISFRLWNLDAASKEEDEFNQFVIDTIRNIFGTCQDFSALLRSKGGVKIAESVYLNTDLRFVWPDPRHPSYGDTGYCYGLRDHIAILNNGTVVPCCLDFQGHLALGNIYQQSLEEILASEIANTIIAGFSQRKIVMDLCQSCQFRLRFGH